MDNLTEEAPVDEIQELRVTKPFHVGKDAMFKLIFGGTATGWFLGFKQIMFISQYIGLKTIKSNVRHTKRPIKQQKGHD